MTLKEKKFNNSVERIIANLPSNLTDIEKARYIYLALGKLFCFDEAYMYGKSKTTKKMYTRAKNSSPSFSELQEGRRKKSICVSITKMLNSVLKQVGIDADSVREDPEDKHESTYFVINGQTFKADLTNDLKFIHLNLPTRHFASYGPNTILDEDLEAIDSKLGYFYTGKQVIDSTLKQLQEELADERFLGNKISRILEVVATIPKVKDLNFVERISFYDFMIKHIINPRDNSRFYKNTLYVQDKDDRKKHTAVYSTYDYSSASNSPIFRRFLYSESEKRFVEVSDDELKSFIDNGNYHVHSGNKIPGLNYGKRIER